MKRSAFACFLIVQLVFCTQAFAYEVFSGHPRLLFRDQPWGTRSITTEQLKARGQDERYSGYRQYLTYSIANYAIRAIAYDDSSAGAFAVRKMKASFSFDNTTTDGELVMDAALGFDWLYNHAVLSDSATRQAVIDNIAAGAKHCKEQYIGQGPHIFHTRMPGFAIGVLAAGLALYGHHPDAAGYIDWAYKIWTENLIPGRELQGGTVHNSLAYGRRYILWHTGHFMSMWYSATGDDLYAKSRNEQGDWSYNEFLWLLYGRQPDGLYVRYGDNYRRTSERFTFRAVAERGFGFQDPVALEYLNYLMEWQKTQTDSRVAEEGNYYHVYLYWDADYQGQSFDNLPTRKMFSPEGTGFVVWRTGWNEIWPDAQSKDSYIFFKCGDYFGDHGHFDQGHVEVFKGAPLLVENGYYDSFDADSRMKYWRKTISHNTILAVDPSIPDDEGGQRIYSNQSESTLESYLADEGSETGDIIDYRDEGDFAYVAAEFGTAYDPSRIDNVIRELAWVNERFLIVIDNVALANDDLLPKQLWHYTVTPVIEGRSFTVADGGGRAVVTSLLPENSVIDTVRAYQVGTAYYPPANPTPEYGIGRAEITVPETGEYDHLFVTVIDVDEEGTPAAEVSYQYEGDGTLDVMLPGGAFRIGGTPGSRSKLEFFFESPPSDMKGDYNGDGALAINDVIQLLLLARENPGDPYLDFNEDGSYSITDAISLLLYIIGQN